MFVNLNFFKLYLGVFSFNVGCFWFCFFRVSKSELLILELTPIPTNEDIIPPLTFLKKFKKCFLGEKG